MKDSQNTILITGGSAGIGLALAARFLRNGNEVIICGRRREKLEKSKNQYPRLHIYQCDVSLEQDRRALFEKVTRDFPKLNVLINNAGIASPLQLDLPAQWKETQKLIETNFQAPIHLTQLFAKHLSAQDNPVVMITTSGLAHAPRAQFPVYSATKAALHSITLSMRHQFKSINIEVIEICPPHVDTDLGGPGRNRTGVNLDLFADAVMAQLQEGRLEITYGTSTIAARASREEREEIFKLLNQ